MSDGIGGVPFATKVNALEREVGGDQQLVAAGNVEDCAIVADTVTGFLVAAAGCSADALNEFEFVGGHVCCNK